MIVSNTLSCTTRSSRRSAVLMVTTNEHARTNEPTKVRAQRAQLMSMVTRVGSDALSKANVSVRTVKHRRASANSERDERSAESNAEAKGAGS
eukprot:5803667-Pleurochrysis_carterae.AAC.1